MAILLKSGLYLFYFCTERRDFSSLPACICILIFIFTSPLHPAILNMAAALADVSFYLEPWNDALPAIELSNVEPNILGRSEQWRINDQSISRAHIELNVDLELHSVYFKHVGQRQSSINGVLIRPKGVQRLDVNDVICFLSNSTEHAYTLRTKTPVIVNPVIVAFPANMLVPPPNGSQGNLFMLQPTDPLLPCIELSNDCNNILGRTSDPKWCITNAFISMEHIGMAVHENEPKPVVMRHLGLNPSSVNNVLVSRNDRYCTELAINDVIWFLSHDCATEYTLKHMVVSNPTVDSAVILEAAAPVTTVLLASPMNMSPLLAFPMCVCKHNISATTLLESKRVPVYPSSCSNALGNARMELITGKHERNDLLLVMGIDDYGVARITVQHSSTKNKYCTSIGYNTLSELLSCSDLTVNCKCSAFLKNPSNTIAAIFQGRDPIIDVSKHNHCKHTLVIVALHFFSDPELHKFLKNTPQILKQ